ncbi:MAG: hypothetical protein JW827_06510 [Spirochaetes bacterium]|nr:hypothetical protein [Spirochaetota bacterium]
MKVVKLIMKILAGIVGLIIVGAILLIIFFPTEEVRKIAVKEMSKQLHRKVEIKGLSLNILKGIVIEGVKIHDPIVKKVSGKTFVQCKAFVFQYDLLKLLQRKLVIKKLTIENPEIAIVRYKKGKQDVFNFSDLMPPVPKKLQEPKTETAKTPVKEDKKAKAGMPKVSKGQIPVDVQINKLGLEEARVEIVDTATAKFKEVYTLQNVNFLIENIRIYENKPIHIKTGFGLNVKEYNQGAKTGKDINLEASIIGAIVLFDKKNLLNPTGEFSLSLENGKFYGIQAYDELRNQAMDITKSVSSYQDKLMDSYKKIKDSQSKLGKAGKVAGGAADIAQKLGNMDIGFIKGAMEWKFLKKSFEFDVVKTLLKIQDSKIISENIDLKGADYRAEGNGYTHFDTTLSYLFNLVADKKYNTSELTKAIASKSGDLEFPIQVKGTVSDIKVIFPKNDILAKIQGQLKTMFENKVRSAVGSSDLAKQLLSGVLGGKSVKEAADAKVDEAKKKADEAAKKAEAEAKAKLEAEKQRLEAEKKKQEEAAKKKAEEEAKKKLKKLKF